jgi:hypothetical protein
LFSLNCTPCKNPGPGGVCSYPVIVKNMVDPSDLGGANPLTLFTINVTPDATGLAAKNPNRTKFIPHAPYFPAFLKSITDEEISGTKEVVFETIPQQAPPKVPAYHTIDGKQFDGEVGEVVLLNRAEEWKIVNKSFGPQISHPFHIHINPFQVTEVFDPNEALLNPRTGKPYTDSAGKPLNDKHTNLPAVKYVFWKDSLLAGQCYLDPGNPKSWRPMTWMPAKPGRPAGCVPTPMPFDDDNIWWDVFPIPSGYGPKVKGTDGKKTPINYNGKPIQVPGYFKLRSRFVDFPGFYVIHCHILAHEDRGMMTIVEVAPARTPYSHH